MPAANKSQQKKKSLPFADKDLMQSEMQLVPMEVGSSSTGGSVVQVSFPSAQASVLDGLNRQREDGSLCDLSIHIQGHVFKAHCCVLAASSPYFHDQVLLKNMSTVSIPAVMDPLAFESVLSCAYTGQLRMLRDDIVNYLTVGSALQMWHIVDKCTELLREGRSAAQEGAGGGERSANSGCSSSNTEGDANRAGSTGGVQLVELDEPQRASQPSVSESQSSSSTIYFSPRDGSSFGGGGAAAAEALVDGDRASNTPSYCTPSGGEEALLMEEEDEAEEAVHHQRKRGRGGGRGRRKKSSSMLEQEVGVSDSFGVSSCQDGKDSAMSLQKCPTYSQASGLSLDSAAPPLGMAGGMMGGASFKGSSLKHGAVHLQAVSGADGPDGGGGCSSTSGSTYVFMCQCGKTFTCKSTRDRHINMHLDLRPFHCTVCDKKFKRKHHLTRHVKTHNRLKLYDCISCGKKFMCNSFMRHCERCSGPGDGGDGGGSGDRGRQGGGGGEDGPNFSSSPYHLLSPGEGGQRGKW